MKNILIFSTIFLFLKSVNANCAEILSSNAKYENDRFFISVDSRLDIPAKSAFKILTDYENITILSPKIINSRVISSKKTTTVVRTVVRGCVLFFCKKMTNTQTTTIGQNRIESVTIPEMSDFLYGKMEWTIRKDGEKTIINYKAEIEPDFFIPPLIGSYFITSSMKEEAETLAKRIEEVANESQTNQP